MQNAKCKIENVERAPAGGVFHFSFCILHFLHFATGDVRAEAVVRPAPLARAFSPR
jgi:hypothetical protein